LRLQLAQLYENTGQIAKAETEYEQILLRQKNNLKALVGKSSAASCQGDTKTASPVYAGRESCFQIQVEEVRAAAQKTLQPHVK